MEEIFVTELMKKLGSVAALNIGIMAGALDEDLQNLMDTLEILTYVISESDAGKMQMKDIAVRLWLRRLQDVAYDADDILDEISYEATRQSQEDGDPVKVRSLFKIKFGFNQNTKSAIKISKRIKNINQILDEIAKHCPGFQPSVDDLTDRRSSRMTSPFVDDSKMVGREKDKSRIVEMLLMTNPSWSSYDKFSTQVISIVGMGGLGKTTLAQLVYNDDSIMRSFELRAWVFVSENFDTSQILTNILESITYKKCGDLPSIDLLLMKVAREIRGKKYLLVLDDLWNENAEDWEKLTGYLSVGAQGSKILVTTRKESVACIIRARSTISPPPYNLTTLSNQECLLIIKNKAFSPGGAVETLNMSNIGEEIARKCGGLPLAAVFLGKCMYLENTEYDWLAIRDIDDFSTSEYFDRVLLILKLSYDNLPFYLKQCFSYFSLFPKDWEFNRETLVRLWMAEGFLHSSHPGGNRNSLEDVGNDYFYSLLSNSFFQDVKMDDLGDVTTFKMHVLIHDLARSVVGSHEVTILKASEIENDVSHILRVRLIMEGVPNIFSNVLNNAEKLRSNFSQEAFISLSSYSNKRLRVIHQLGGSSLKTISFPLKFIHMRYLDLSYSCIEDVHAASVSQLYNLQTLNLHHGQNVAGILNRIGSLKNLRHVDLSSSDAKVLPDSIAGITNLKTLDVSGCGGISVLPSNIIGLLQNLSSLNISETRIIELPGSISNLCKLEIVKLGENCKLPKDIKNWVELRKLTYNGETDHVVMPKGLEMLTRLEVLIPYLVRKEAVFIRDSSGIGELAGLNFLGVLQIRCLENVRGKVEAERAKLKNKKYLKELSLKWEEEEDEEEEGAYTNSVVVFEGLQPHHNLKKLVIENFGGVKLPKWMGSSCMGSSSYYFLPNLVELYLSDCNRCEKLPALGMLPCLRILWIHGMRSMKCLGREFYYQLIEEEEEEESTICSTKGTTTTLFPSLVKLIIEKMMKLEEWFGPPSCYITFPCLEKVEIHRCGNLKSVPDFRLCTSLRQLTIRDCYKLNKNCTSYGFIQNEEQQLVDTIRKSKFLLGDASYAFIRKEEKQDDDDTSYEEEQPDYDISYDFFHEEEQRDESDDDDTSYEEDVKILNLIKYRKI